MAIDTKPFVRLGNHKRLPSMHYEHYDGCELEHVACAVLYLAGALDAAQKRLDEYKAEIERLRVENAAARAFNAPLIGDWAGDVWAFDDDDSVTHLPERKGGNAA